MLASVYLQVDMKASDDAGLPIREVARRFDVPTHVLRHWEDVGLLSPARDASGYRRYARTDLVRVAVIARNKLIGMSLPHIRALLDEGAPGRHQVLEAHLQHLDEQRRELERSRAMTEHSLRCRAHDIAQCERFAALVADVIDGGPVPSDWDAAISLDGPPGASSPDAASPGHG